MLLQIHIDIYSMNIVLTYCKLHVHILYMYMLVDCSSYIYMHISPLLSLVDWNYLHIQIKNKY